MTVCPAKSAITPVESRCDMTNSFTDINIHMDSNMYFIMHLYREGRG